MYKFKSISGETIECELQEPTLSRRKRLAIYELSQQKETSELKVNLESLREKTVATFSGDVDQEELRKNVVEIVEKSFAMEARIYKEILSIILSGNVGEIDFENINEKEAKRARMDFFGL